MGIKMTMAMALLAIAVSPMAGAAPVAQWVDPATGHRVLRLTHKPGSASLYFHQNSYTSQGDKMVFSTPDGTQKAAPEIKQQFGQAHYAANGPDEKLLSFAEAKEVRLNERLEARIPMEIFNIDIRTGKRKVIVASTDWLNHIQFSPTDPGLIMYCHEGPWHKVDRIWTVRTDGGGQTLGRVDSYRSHSTVAARVTTAR